MGALDRILAAGHDISPIKNHKFPHLRNDYGIDINGRLEVVLKIECIRDLPSAIQIVANASQNFAERLFGSSLKRSKRDIKKELSTRISHIFPNSNIKNNAYVMGGSRRNYTMDIKASYGNKAVLINEITPHRVNAIFASSFDILKRNDTIFELYSVYDEENGKDLTPESLSFIAESGTKVIPYEELSKKRIEKDFHVLREA